VTEQPFAQQPPLWRRLPSTLSGRLLRTARGRNLLAQAFNRAYYESAGAWREPRWLRFTSLQTPQDLWVCEEILVETRPDVIVETGTFAGGTALYLATICDALRHGQVLSIDVRHSEPMPRHPRIEYLTGSSTDPRIVDEVGSRLGSGGRLMALLDSDHSRDHVLAELHAYGPLIAEGCYMIVADTNINGHPAVPHWGPGPMEAVEEFLAAGAPFAADRSREKFLLTFNPRGFLRRLSEP
jgi:cephalosporin hydroxylase